MISRREYFKLWRSKNRDKVNNYYKIRRQKLSTTQKRSTRARQRYGIPSELFLKIEDQLNNGPCDICNRINIKMHIDHDHITKQFRGILCQPCNMALGLLQDDPEIVIKLLIYLNRYKSEDF